jgi:Na+/H+ antiporter NhaB
LLAPVYFPIILSFLLSAKTQLALFDLNRWLILGVIDNDFNGTGWADRVAIAAYIAFGVVDKKLLIMLINCLERAPFLAFPAGNACFCYADTPKRDVLAAKAKAGTQ